MLVLGILVERIRAFGGAWSDGGLWDDTLRLADRAWTAHEDDERRIRWHHLVMTVGTSSARTGDGSGPPASQHLAPTGPLPGRSGSMARRAPR
jgi:hypothetical protein